MSGTEFESKLAQMTNEEKLALKASAGIALHAPDAECVQIFISQPNRRDLVCHHLRVATQQELVASATFQSRTIAVIALIFSLRS
jgi:hypothetical protein